MSEFEQPMMDCPKCGKEYEDFDGVGVVFCSPEVGGCGFCRHLGFDHIENGKMRCNFCGVVKDQNP